MKKIALIFVVILFSHFAYSQSCLPEGIEFYLQAQIDSFPVNYPGCTRIEGDVSIGNTHEISNLDGLSVLTSIGGNLKIVSNYSLVDLTGLEGLDSIGDELQIINNTVLTSLAGLDNLHSIGGDLKIRYNQSLEDATGLQNLAASSIIDLSIIDNPCLTDCNAQSLCDYLSGPNGIVTIYNNGAGCSNPPDIAESCNMQMPCLPFGSYYFTTQAEIDNFSTDYPDCNQLTSFVNISGNDIDNLAGLSGVTCINGTFSVSDNLALIDLEGLDNLDSITEHLFVSDNKSLNSLAGLETLSYIKGSLVVCFNTVLSSLEGLEGLDTVSGNVEIRDNENLVSVDGLNTIATVECHLLIENNPNLENLDGLENLKYVGLQMIIGGNDALNNITGMSNLSYLGDELWIGNNENLHDLSGLESLDSIGGNLAVKDNNSLSHLSGLNSIASIGGYLEIADNDALVSLQALHNLSSIGGGMMIYMNDNLSSLDGIDNIHAGTISDLIIDNNNLLSTCEVTSVCDYLSNPNGPATIENNTEGCNSTGEVLEACEVGVDQLTVDSRQLTVSMFPNPAKGIVDCRLSIFDGRFGRVMLKIFDVQGRERMTVLDEMKPSGEYNVQFDASLLEPGIYFYRLTADGAVSGGKLIVMR